MGPSETATRPSIVLTTTAPPGYNKVIERVHAYETTWPAAYVVKEEATVPLRIQAGPGAGAGTGAGAGAGAGARPLSLAQRNDEMIPWKECRADFKNCANETAAPPAEAGTHEPVARPWVLPWATGELGVPARRKMDGPGTARSEAALI